ncbi:MAG TPA: type IV secretion system protein TraC [Burkholderiaceae bacterium]|nr:type IV secretion system protein TraC [Burkholderiaceae bacterium]
MAAVIRGARQDGGRAASLLARLLRGRAANVQMRATDAVAKGPPLVDRFGGVLPYLSFDAESQLFALEGATPGLAEAVGYVLEVSPQSGVSEEMAVALASAIGSALPAGSGVQMTMFASPRIDHILTQYVDSVVADRTPGRDASLRMLAETRARFLQRGALQAMHPHSNLRTRHFRAWLSVTIPSKDPFSEEARRIALTARQAHIGALRSQHLYGWTWSADDLIATCWGLLNPHIWMRGDSAALAHDAGRELRYQMMASDTMVQVFEDRIEFSSLRSERDALAVVGMSVRGYPPALSLASTMRTLGSEISTVKTYPCPFLITTGIVIPDYDKEKSRVVMMAANAERNASSPIARYVPRYAELRDEWKIAQAAFDAGQTTVRLYSQLLLYCDPKDRQEAEETARAIWREANIEIANDRLVHMPALLASMPMTLSSSMAADIRRARRDSTKTIWNTGHMCPVAAEWQGTGPRDGPNGTRLYPHLLLVGRRGQVMNVDLFANRSGNYNAIVCGTSGSGKSVLLNELVMRTLAMGGLVFVIDSGYSYQKLCAHLGGQFIDVTPEQPICLNPFSMTDDLDVGLPLLVPLIEQMTSYTGQLSEYEIAQLHLHLTDVWYTAQLAGRKPTLTELAESLKHNCYLGGSNPTLTDADFRRSVAEMSEEERQRRCDPRIRDLGVRLGPFTSDGAYGRYFDAGDATIDFRSDFVVLELNGLSQQRHLQSVVLLMLLYQITTRIFSPRHRLRQKLVVIDEAWQLLGEGEGSGGAAQFIEHAYRTARKWNASIVTATQSIADYERSAAARAAFANSDNTFLLRQKAESIEALAASGKLAIDEYQRTLLRSLNTIQGMFSEVFVRVGENPPAVGRMILDPFSLLLYSSKAADVEAIRAYTERGLDVASAIRQVLVDRGVRP